MAYPLSFQVCHDCIFSPDASSCTGSYSAEPPFDRHDWIVRRPRTGEEVRYVIDYYSAPPEADGSPVFSLDVRPALDSFSSIKERVSVATEEVWANFRKDGTPGTPRSGS
jgi:hypothetical protein